jgi:tryptophan synthase alpha chain
MSRVLDVFKGNKKKALIAYITMGYPDINSTCETVKLLADSGCDIIELGIPFSDPLADGVTIQNASYHALQNGVTPRTCIETVCGLRKTVDIPLIFMTYYNPVFSYGLERFCLDCAMAGIDGLIIPDLSPDEGTDLEKLTIANNIDLVYMLAPTSTEERIKTVAERSRGFIYMVSVTGVTGARNSLPDNLNEFVRRVKRATDTPVCIGFGISNAEQAAEVGAIADGVIVGSRIIQLMEADDAKVKLNIFIGQLRTTLDRI